MWRGSPVCIWARQISAAAGLSMNQCSAADLSPRELQGVRGRGPIVQSSRSHALLRLSVTRPATHAQQTVVIRVALPATLRGHREAGIGVQAPIP